MIRGLVILFVLLFLYGIATAHLGAGLMSLVMAVFIALAGKRMADE